MDTTTIDTTVRDTFLREKLIPALRSGEYEQGHGYLHIIERPGTTSERHTYCCIGVMCDLIDPDKWLLEEAQSIIGGKKVVAYTGDTWMGVMPGEVARLYGFPSGGDFRLVDEGAVETLRDGLVDVPEHVRNNLLRHSSLVGMNDSGVGFDHIADVIEFIIDHPEIVRFDDPN